MQQTMTVEKVLRILKTWALFMFPCPESIVMSQQTSVTATSSDKSLLEIYSISFHDTCITHLAKYQVRFCHKCQNRARDDIQRDNCSTELTHFVDEISKQAICFVNNICFTHIVLILEEIPFPYIQGPNLVFKFSFRMNFPVFLISSIKTIALFSPRTEFDNLNKFQLWLPLKQLRLVHLICIGIVGWTDW